MVSVSTLLMLCALAGSPAEPTLLEFTTTGCSHCRKMEPILARLSAAGYPVQKVQADDQPQLVKQFHVHGYPTFVLVDGSRELARIEGECPQQKLEGLFASASYKPGGKNRLPREYERYLAASVRITVDDERGSSFGSGTIVDQREGAALVLTCGHIFRESQGKGKITVELFDRGNSETMTGELLRFNLERDLGLLVIHPPRPLTAVRIAPPAQRLKVGDRVISVGSSQGQSPSAQESRISALDKFLGPANIEVAGQPAQGRSGGGLFTADGLLVGVCNAADPMDDEGLFAAVTTIQKQLDELGLAELYRETPTRLAVSSGSTKEAAEPPLPKMPDDMQAQVASATSPRPPESQSGLSEREQAALAQLRNVPEGAEVICIIRSVDNPQAKSDVIYLDRASPQFLQQLAAERRNQEARVLTSFGVDRTARREDDNRSK
jgi:S1-C subfamily serine protease